MPSVTLILKKLMVLDLQMDESTGKKEHIANGIGTAGLAIILLVDAADMQQSLVFWKRKHSHQSGLYRQPSYPTAKIILY
jgi:hypothetical protein